MINQTISHYRLEKKLGSGGMGEVYMAIDERLNRAVAIKILPHDFAKDPQRVKRFLQEARAASALNHPNVGHIYEIDEHKGAPFIAMEFIRGQNLAEIMHEKKLNAEEIMNLALQISDALGKAHAAGIVHRDIKPNNIMVTDSGQVKIVDFGLAKLLQPESADSQLATATQTEFGTVLGTVPYMSPEQAFGRKVDARTDVFSFGVVLYEMAAAKRPFSGTSAMAMIDQIAHADPEPISNSNRSIPPELERIIQKCLQKDPENRYQTAHDIFIDLRNLQHVPTTRPAHMKQRRSRWLWLAPVLLFAFLLALWFARAFPPHQESRVPIRIAVLPFHLLTSDKDMNHLSVGIPDSIITRLSNIRQIRLSPTNAILNFTNQQANLKEVGKKLKADNIITGTIQKTANRFRINVQMIRVKDGVALWGQQYDLAPEDLLKLEDDIANKVSEKLKINLSAEDRERVYRRYTQNSAAYNSYLHGRYEMAKFNRGGVLAAIYDFENCLRLDPQYALARAGLALASAEMHLRYAPAEQVKDWGDKAKMEAQQALETDPNLAEAHEALAAVYLRTDFNWDDTIKESRRALELNPNLELPHYYIAGACYHLGLLELATKEVEKGLEGGGQNKFLAFRTQGVVALISGNYAEAASKLEEAQRVSGKPLSDSYLAHAYYGLKKFDEANSLLKELSQSSSASAVARSLAARAAFLADGGDVKGAKKLADSVAKGQYMDHHAAYDLGSAYALIGNNEEALLWLRRSVDSGLPCYPLFARDPLLRTMRANAAFQQLLAELQKKYTTAQKKYESLSAQY